MTLSKWYEDKRFRFFYPAWLKMLHFIGEHEGSTTRDVEKKLGLNHSTAGATIILLERAGLVKRMMSGRMKKNYLSPKGKEAYEAFKKLYEVLITSEEVEPC